MRQPCLQQAQPNPHIHRAQDWLGVGSHKDCVRRADGGGGLYCLAPPPPPAVPVLGHDSPALTATYPLGKRVSSLTCLRKPGLALSQRASFRDGTQNGPQEAKEIVSGAM